MKYSEYLRHIRAIVETTRNPWLCIVSEDCPYTRGSDNHTRFGKDVNRALGATSSFLPAALVRDGLIEPFSVPPGKYEDEALAAWSKQVRLDWLDELIAAAEMGTMSPS